MARSGAGSCGLMCGLILSFLSFEMDLLVSGGRLVFCAGHALWVALAFYVNIMTLPWRVSAWCCRTVLCSPITVARVAIAATSLCVDAAMSHGVIVPHTPLIASTARRASTGDHQRAHSPAALAFGGAPAHLAPIATHHTKTAPRAPITTTPLVAFTPTTTTAAGVAPEVAPSVNSSQVSSIGSAAPLTPRPSPFAALSLTGFVEDSEDADLGPRPMLLLLVDEPPLDTLDTLDTPCAPSNSNSNANNNDSNNNNNNNNTNNNPNNNANNNQAGSSAPGGVPPQRRHRAGRKPAAAGAQAAAAQRARLAALVHEGRLKAAQQQQPPSTKGAAKYFKVKKGGTKA